MCVCVFVLFFFSPGLMWSRASGGTCGCKVTTTKGQRWWGQATQEMHQPRPWGWCQYCYRTTHVSNPPVRETRQWQSDWIFGVYYQIWCLKIWCLVSDLIIRFGVYYLPVFLTFLGERETGKERGVKGRNQRHTTIQSLGKVLIFSSKIKNQNVHLCCLIGSTQKNVLIS